MHYNVFLLHMQAFLFKQIHVYSDNLLHMLIIKKIQCKLLYLNRIDNISCNIEYRIAVCIFLLL
jgi:hypothetical protein